MKRITASIYVHLTLVLLIALGASFATMYILFLSRLEQTRNNHFAGELVTQVRLVEALLQNPSPTGAANVEGIRIVWQPPQSWGVIPDSKTKQRLMLLQQRLTEQLQRDVKTGTSSDARPGLWIKLHTPATQPQWIFIPTPERRPLSGLRLEQVLLVGFAVFFAGGMMLLWRIQRPLKQLSSALELVGQGQQLAPLPVSGASEIRILTQRYNAMVERLQSYEEERATMLAGVAHDLRSPITRLRLLLALIKHPRNSEIIHNLDDIERITEQFLDYARGQSDEAVTRADLAILIEEVAAPYSAQGVATQCEEESIVAPVRTRSLRRAMVNLIENAIEYGRAPITVRLSATRTAIIIAIEDSGDGIPQQEIQKALRPFTRLDPSRGGKGHCGLGLVIAAKIAAQHQGTLELRNRQEGGLSAALQLPRNS